MQTKRFSILLLGLIMSIICTATTNKVPEAVSMVSYEQSWLDHKGTIALKNNTNKDINKVSFRITYLDMSGVPLDYEDFSYDIDIAPGTTRQLDLPAYQRERMYSYYKSEHEHHDNKIFKIKYELTGYNESASDNGIGETTTDFFDDVTHQDNNDGSISFIISIITLLFVIGSCIGLYILVAVMAKSRGRNVAVWILLSIIGSPILMAIILLIIGNADEKEVPIK